MVKERVDLLGLLRKQAAEADLDFLREAVTVLAEALMDAEVSAQIGAEYGERTPARSTQRNGYRPRRWDTRVGTVELQNADRAPAAQRAGAARRGAAGLRGGRLHAACRRPRAGAGLRGDLEEPGLAHLR